VDHLREVAVGRSDDADVDLDRLLAADAAHGALLQDAQQHGLDLGRQLADLVEQAEHRAAIRSRFVAQLAAHLERVAEQRGLEVCEVVSSGGDADAPRSITLRLRGDVLAQLTDELGTHLLIQRSATRGRASRKRWFAAVSVHATPDEPPVDISTIPRDALVITACRAGGPGGQHVNKVSSAVRVHHLPSGIAIRSAAARSQRANLDQALRRLVLLLRERADARVTAGQATRRHAHYELERGRPVRAYQLGDDGLLVERSPS
jgi:peptide chain release factor 2/peptide chain release factor